MKQGGGSVERETDKRAAMVGRGCGAKRRRLETYADVVQKQKESLPPEPILDKPKVLTTLMKVKAVRRKMPRRSSLQIMAEEYALSDTCEDAIVISNTARPKRLPYTQSLLEVGVQVKA